MKHVCAAALFHVCARAAVYSTLFGSGPARSCIGKRTASGARLGPRGGGGCSFFFFFKPPNHPQQPAPPLPLPLPFRPKLAVNPCTSPWRAKQSMSERLGPADCPAPSRSRFLSDRKKMKIFLSPVAGQAVDVGASRAGRLPCSESISLSIRSKKKVKIFLSPVAGQLVDVGASRAGRLPC